MSYKENGAYGKGYGNDSTSTGYGNNQSAYRDNSSYGQNRGYGENSNWKSRNHGKQNSKTSFKVIMFSGFILCASIVYMLYFS